MAGKHQVEPLFVKHNIKFNSKKPISHCKIQNGVVLIGLQSQSLQHIRIQTGKFTDIPLNLASNDKIAYIHLDYRGSHAIISTELGENYYMNMKTVALKPLWRLKGHTISAVGFNAERATDQETSFIVLGTNKGTLMETNIASSGSASYAKRLSSNLVENAPISSINIVPYSLDNDLSWLLIVCTPGRLYCIPGTLNVEAMEKVVSQPVVGTVWTSSLVEQQAAVLQNFFSAKSNPRYHSLGDQKDEKPSDVVIFPTCIEEITLPERYCWLASEGVSLGHFETTRTDGFDIINEDWFRKHDLSEGKYNYPLSVALSEYHIFMIYQEKFVAISILDQKVAFEDVFMDASNVLGMCRDATSEFIWIFSENGLFYYRPDRETRDVWKVLIERNEFSKARKIAKQMADKRPYQIVLKKEAEKFLNDNNFVAAAELLAQSTEPFENTVLKFLKNPNSRDSRNGLKRYLELKLDALDKRVRFLVLRILKTFYWEKI
ncbi:unnamed protein product [Bursaphelenchus xylophilus]|uniref:(pine wood nematode) hypothetical protein n=1 Tax=Bursaphelenchus xylophilus TaxID=6326 RepID=A0A1I7SRL5_BURXY|nr:unnamed protein product [Bursaphelenchus xylophilus]CAG9102191.1 unnamed protein product [Bursaphelenchus xylophilus]